MSRARHLHFRPEAMPSQTAARRYTANLKIYLDNWASWEPSGDGHAHLTVFSGGQLRRAGCDKPSLPEVPPMQRRRLSPLARVVFQVLTECEASGTVVFSSVMGEIQRTQSILNTIAAQQSVSPAAFSLSVHNAIAGQWSMIHGETAPMLALCPPNGSAVPALIEAAGLLAESDAESVTVVLYEEAYPNFYAPFLTGPADATALAMRLISPARHDHASAVLSVHTCPSSPITTARGGPLDLQPLLLGDVRDLEIREPQVCWRVESVT